MKSFSFRQIFIGGITLAIPLAIVFYVLLRVVGIITKVITPVARKMGISHLLGEITLTVLTIVILLVLVLLLGLLMQLGFVVSFKTYLQDKITQLVPSLNYLKLVAAEKLHIEDSASTWKPVLLENDNLFSPAFIIEETDEWVTLVSVKPPSTEPDTIFITRKAFISYQEISMKQMIQCNKQFGKGYLAFIINGQKHRP